MNVGQNNSDEKDTPKGLWASAIGAYKTYKESENIVALESAIQFARDAISRANGSNLSWPRTLSIFLLRRFEKTAKIVDLDEAIRIARKALESTLPDSPSYAAYSSTLGVQLWKRFEHTGKPADLDEAIAMTEKAVESSLPNDHNYPLYLNHLGIVLQRRFTQTGETATLDKAITMAGQAAEYDHPDRAAFLNTLGKMLEQRSNSIGNMADLDKAIETAWKMLESPLCGHLPRVACLAVLSTRLLNRFTRTKQVADLVELTRIVEIKTRNGTLTNITIPHHYIDPGSCNRSRSQNGQEQ